MTKERLKIVGVILLILLGILMPSKTRTALPKSAVTKTVYYVDDAHWVSKRSTLESGLKTFYNKTGVQPILYLTKSNGNLNTLAQRVYSERVMDEAHIVVVLNVNTYGIGMKVGTRAQTVLDTQARNVLREKLEASEFSTESKEKAVSKAFSETATQIMKKPKKTKIKMTDVLYIAVIGAGYIFLQWKRRNQPQA